MCDAVQVRLARILSVVPLLAAAMLAMPASRADAQSSAELGQRVAALADSMKATQKLLNVERVRQALPLDDSLVVDGVTVLFPGIAIDARNRNAVREGIIDARRSLDERFGAGTSSLLDGDLWSITFPNHAPNAPFERAAFAEGRDPSARTRNGDYSLPLSAGEIEDFMLSRAGRRLMQRNAVLDEFVGVAFSFRDNERQAYVARRLLALSASSVARNCAAGAMSACRTVLNPQARDKWFAPSDSARPNARAVPLGVHGSLARTALDVGGPRFLQAISAPNTSDEPLVILATAAGVTPDSLLRAWSAGLNESGATNAEPTLAFAAAAFFWSGFFLLIATRRRPR